MGHHGRRSATNSAQSRILDWEWRLGGDTLCYKRLNFDAWVLNQRAVSQDSDGAHCLSPLSVTRRANQEFACWTGCASELHLPRTKTSPSAHGSKWTRPLSIQNTASCCQLRPSSTTSSGVWQTTPKPSSW